MKYLRQSLIAFALCLSISAVAAESIPTLSSFLGHSFPDNTDVRKQYWNNLITAPKESVWAFSERILTSASAGQVKVRAQKRGGDFLVQFLNNPDSSSGQGFLEYSRGSYSIQRDLKTGYILQAKIFLQDDPSCYVRLYPQAEGTRVDVVMYGALLKKGLYVSGLIYYVLAAPFSEIVDQTRRSFDWATVFGLDGRGRAASLAQDLRASLAVPGPVFVQASLPPLSGAAAREKEGAPAPQALTPPSASRLLLDMVARAVSMDSLAQGLAGRGYASSEFLPPATTAAPVPGPLAIGLSDDSDPLVPALPYRSFPRYEAGKGLPLASIRASLFLDSLSSPDAVYALLGEGYRALVAPSFDASGRFAFSCFIDGKEVSWEELSSKAEKSLRILRIGLPG